MIVYYSSSYMQNKILKDLQKKRTSNNNPANFLSCPAVKDSWHNMFMFSPRISSKVTYSLDSAIRSNDLPIKKFREPHLKGTNIFNLECESYFFSEKPLKIKVTAPYFHDVDYQKNGTFIGGIFDIGRWFRPIDSEIITWSETGSINFKAEEPLFYVEFLTDEDITLKEFKINPIIKKLAINLINSPFQNLENLQGSLYSRYKAFDKSDYRNILLQEIKSSLVSNE